MTTSTLDPKYVDIGNLDEIVQTAIQRYAIEQINDHLEKARQKIGAFEAKYGVSYEQFCDLITTDEVFLEKLEAIDCTWEADLNSWEFYSEDLSLWLGRLKNISECGKPLKSSPLNSSSLLYARTALTTSWQLVLQKRYPYKIKLCFCVRNGSVTYDAGHGPAGSEKRKFIVSRFPETPFHILHRSLQLGLKGAMAGKTTAYLVDQRIGGRLVSPQPQRLSAGHHHHSGFVVTLAILVAHDGLGPFLRHSQAPGQDFRLLVIRQGYLGQ